MKTLSVFILSGILMQFFNFANAQELTTYLMPYTGATSVYACGGTKIYDHGGPNANYSNYANGVLTIRPEEAGKAVQLDFDMFSVEMCCDYLEIFDGTSTNASYSRGRFNRNPGRIISGDPTGAITLRFYSDFSIVSSGFEASVTCVDKKAELSILSGNISPAGVLSPGQNFSVSGNIRNFGGIVAESVQIGFFLSESPVYNESMEPYSTLELASISFLTTVSYSQSLNLPEDLPSGRYYLFIYVDFENQIQEYDETNNLIVVPINVGLYMVPRFQHMSEQISICQGVVSDNGGPNDNYGDNSNGWLVINPSEEGHKVRLEFMTFELEVGYDSLEIYNGVGVTDPANKIGAYFFNPGTVYSTDESGALTLRFISDRSHNFRGFTASVTCVESVPYPDLEFQDYSINIQEISIGGNVEIISTITNIGGIDAATHNIGYYLSTTDVINDQDDKELGISTVNSLLAGNSKEIVQSLQIPNDVVPGNYYINLRIDNDNVLEESNRNNNFASIPVTISNFFVAPYKQKLEISTCSGKIYDNGSKINNYKDNASDTLVITSIGSEDEVIQLYFKLFDLESCCDYIEIYDGTEINEGALIGRYNYNPSFVRSSAGELTLIFYSDESVNASGFEAKIHCIDPLEPFLTLSNASLSTSNLFSDNAVEASCTIENIGGVEASAGIIHYYISENDILDDNDYYLGYINSGVINAGEVTEVINGLVIPEDFDNGRYYIIFLVENPGVINEEDQWHYASAVRLNINKATANQLYAENQVTLSPNPSSGIFNLNISGNLNKLVNITVFNNLGVSVLDKEFVNQGTSEIIDLSQFTGGLYNAKIVVEGKTQVIKLIKY
ncbi:MAG: CUB domain-containing protein [Cytophagaceae bacterium]